MLDLQVLRTDMCGRAGAKRMLHILAVEQEADVMAQRWGADRAAARRAALLHDATKELPLAEQLKLCEKYDIVTSPLQRSSTKLLHAMTGASLARIVYGEAEAIVSAVRWHTTARADMALLEKIVYLADFVDVTRRFDEVGALRARCYENLDSALLFGIDLSIRFLLDEGQPVCPDALNARNYLLGY